MLGRNAPPKFPEPKGSKEQETRHRREAIALGHEDRQE